MQHLHVSGNLAIFVNRLRLRLLELNDKPRLKNNLPKGVCKDSPLITHQPQTTMTFQELSTRRFSLRSYTPQPVTDDELNYILECARLAPSAVNYQPWHYYVVTSEAAKAQLQQCYNREWFRTAPCYIVVSVRHDEEWVRKNDGKRHGDIDAAITAEHICLAAAETGLGTCWVCNFDAARCKQILQLPADEDPVVIIPLGHPDPQAAPMPKNRKPMEELATRI